MAYKYFIAQQYICALHIVIALIFIPACSKPHVPSVNYFLVRVDSISIPDSISQTDTLKIKLYGTIGNNGNYAFDRFEAERSAHNLSLTVWGKYTKNDYATQALVFLNKEYPISTLYPGLFKINILQPDSTYLRDSVVVH
jgi:hypothetical protein